MTCQHSCGCGAPCLEADHRTIGGDLLHACDVHWPRTGPSNVIPFDFAQHRVMATLERPESNDRAADIATVATTENGARSLGVGLYSPPNDKAWLLTPDQADALALSLVRCAAEARRMPAFGEPKEPE